MCITTQQNFHLSSLKVLLANAQYILVFRTIHHLLHNQHNTHLLVVRLFCIDRSHLDIRNQLTAIINQSLADAIKQTKKDLREIASQAAKLKTDLADSGEDEEPTTQQP